MIVESLTPFKRAISRNMLNWWLLGRETTQRG
jgi:hypothetical protein